MAATAASMKLKNSSNIMFRSRSRSRFKARFYISVVFFVASFSILILYIYFKYVQVSRLCESAATSEVRIFRLDILKRIFSSYLTWFGYKHKQDGGLPSGVGEDICSLNSFDFCIFLLWHQLPGDIESSSRALIAFLVKTISACLELAAAVKVQLVVLPSLLFYVSLILLLAVLALATFLVFCLRRKKNMDGYYLNVSLNSSSHLSDESLLDEDESRLTISNAYQLDKPRPRGKSQSVISRLSHGFLLLLVVAASISLPWEFVRLYQREVAVRASRITMGMPAECQETSSSLWASLCLMLRNTFSWASSDGPCHDYYYALLVDPVWEVSPLIVLSSITSRCLLHPVQVASAALGRSLRQFFSEIPAQWQPFLMLVAVVMILVLLLMTCSYRLSIPLLLRIEPRTPVHGPTHGARRKEEGRLGAGHADMGHNSGSLSPLRRGQGDVVCSTNLQKSAGSFSSSQDAGEREMRSSDSRFVLRRSNNLHFNINQEDLMFSDTSNCSREDPDTRGFDNISTAFYSVPGKKSLSRTKVNCPNEKSLKRTTRTSLRSYAKGKGQGLVEALRK